MLVAVLVFCPNYAQIMLAFQNYATFLKNYSVHKLHNSQDKLCKLCRLWSILSVLATL